MQIGAFSSITDLIFSFFNNIMAMFTQLENFLFQNVSVGAWTFQVWQLITGSLFIFFLISWLIGKIIGWGWFS